MATLNGFYGVGKKKAGRRTNRPGGSPRKMYPYARREQRGTAMENFVDQHYDQLIEQGNPPVGRLNKQNRLERQMSTGGLRHTWDGVHRGLNAVKNIAAHMKKSGGTAKQAREHMIGISAVSYGADPRSR